MGLIGCVFHGDILNYLVIDVLQRIISDVKYISGTSPYRNNPGFPPYLGEIIGLVPK